MMMVLLAQTPADGVIRGGWEYVIAAYAITWLVLVGYAVNLYFRRRAAEAILREEA